MTQGGPPEPGELLELATGAALAAGTFLLELGGTRKSLRQGARAKSSLTDLVSQADLDSERLVLDRLLAARPDDGVLAEEGGERPGTSGVVWVVDPLDGTINYLYGYGSFAVSIGARLHGTPVAGVVLDPLREELFEATLGGGAALNGEPLRLPDPPPLAEALVATGFGYRAALREAQGRLVARVLPAVRDLRRSGTASLDLCALAAGRVDAYYEAGLGPWDEAAGKLIATEAGAATLRSASIMPGFTTLAAAAPGLIGDLVALLGHEEGGV